MATQLYSEPVVESLSMEQLRAKIDSNTLTQPRIVSPIMNGNMLGLLTVGSLEPGSTARVEIDGTNTRIIINDGTNDRVLIGYDPGGF